MSPVRVPVAPVLIVLSNEKAVRTLLGWVLEVIVDFDSTVKFVRLGNTTCIFFF